MQPQDYLLPPTTQHEVQFSAEDDKIDYVMTAVEYELRRAADLHGPMHSFHEGYAVILEEMDELWDQIKLRSELQDRKNMKEEAIQIAAMASRLVVDLL